jgi:hypothetical protein
MAKQEVQTMDKKEVIQGRDLAVEAAITQAEIREKAKYALAYQRPRDENRCEKRILDAVKLPEFAEMCFYSYPRANKEIFGGSIKLATEIARVFGNFDIDREIVNDEGDTRTIKVTVTDLETNFHSSSTASFKKLVQRKVGDTGVTKWIQVDERDLRELTNRHFSLLTRNCIFDMVPRWFINMVVDKARETVKKHIKKADIAGLRQKMLKEFDSMGIYQADLEKYLGHAFDTTTPEEITELQGILSSIREGVVDRAEYFGPAAKAKEEKQKEKEKPDMTLDQVMAGEVKTETREEPTERGSKEGKTPEASPASDSLGPGDDKIFETFKTDVLSRKTPKEVQEYFKKVRGEAKAMRIGDALMAKMSNFVNDRLRELLKTEK